MMELTEDEYVSRETTPLLKLDKGKAEGIRHIAAVKYSRLIYTLHNHTEVL